MGVPRVEPTAGDDTVDMRVEQQQLRPGVQDGGDGDLGAQAAEAKGVSVAGTLDRTIGLVVCDPVRVQQIVWNLLSTP